MSDDSEWINGQDWTHKDSTEFPVSKVDEIKLSQREAKVFNDEMLKGNCRELSFYNLSCNFTDSKERVQILEERYKFCNYVIDPNRFRLKKVINVLALVIMFVNKVKLRLRMKVDENQSDSLKNTNKVDKYLVTEGKRQKLGKDVEVQCQQGQVIILHEDDTLEAWNYFYRKSTAEIKHFLGHKEYSHISYEKDGILYYKGRILPTQSVQQNALERKYLSDVMLDLSATSFCVPLVDSRSPFAFSIINEIHWFDPNARHSGVETVLRFLQKIAHILGGRRLVKRFRKACTRCRLLSLRTLEVSMGPVKQCNLNIAPAFYMSQVDICGPFNSYSSHNKRATVKIWYIIFCCSTTGAISIKVMEDYSTTSFLLGFIRFACSFGYPKMLMIDEGGQLMKGCRDMQIDFYDLQFRLNREYGIEFQTCPVGGHNVHGRVERKIRHIQESIDKKCSKERLSFIQWETLGDEVANSINNLPIGIGSIVSDVENLDLITPNRLLLGRNNARSPAGSLVVTGDSSKIIESNEDIFTVWFQSWLISYVPRLMGQPKWFQSGRDVKVGDVVLFLRTEKEYARNYQYGIVKETELSRDGKIRAVSIEYCNFKEKSKRVTRRSIREIVMIHPVDEVSILQELGEIAKLADVKQTISNSTLVDQVSN